MKRKVKNTVLKVLYTPENSDISKNESTITHTDIQSEKISDSFVLEEQDNLEIALDPKKSYRRRLFSSIRTTLSVLITVAAAAVLVAVLWLPVLQIYGTSMSPTLTEGNYVVCIKSERFDTGEICAFYYNNKILVKRVIAHSGDWVDIDENGLVYVNNVLLDEPYVSDYAFGECDIELPYQVPESRIFVMGDHRSTSVDSRSTTVGCVAEEQIVGKIKFCIWPLKEFGPVK